MIPAGFSRWLAASGFERRATPAPGGRIIYALADGSCHVELGLWEWEALGERFAGEARAVSRRANWCYAGLPPAILLYALTIGQFLWFSGIVILLAVFVGPIAIYLWQAHRIRAIAERIDSELAGRRTAAAPLRTVMQLPRWLEIAAALLVGPHLVFEVYGSLNPGAFRNTPWSGTQLDWWGAAGFLILATIFVVRRRFARIEAALPPLPPLSSPAAGRNADFVTRAREGGGNRPSAFRSTCGAARG